MDASLIALIGGVIAAASLLLRPKDVGPMLVNIGLIVLGVAGVLWLYTNPGAQQSVQNWVNTTGMQLLWLILAQPFVFLAAWGLHKWTQRWTGPYTVEREGDLGGWNAMATTPSYWKARGLAHDSHRRIRNRYGKEIYRGPQVNSKSKTGAGI